MKMTPQQPRLAVLIFADAQERDLRRRALPAACARLLQLPKSVAQAVHADVHWFTDRGGAVKAQSNLVVHPQRGRDFNQRLTNAVDDLAGRGYDRIIIVGRDCPQLSSDDIAEAAILLDRNRLVLGPDHRGGCWLIALHAADRHLLTGVRWQHNTDAAELLSRFGADRAAVLQIKLDLDSMEDLRLLSRQFAPAAQILKLIAPRRADRQWIPLAALARLRIAVQLPPPIAA